MDQPHTPFDSIESARDYIRLLREAVEEAERTIEREIAYPCAFTGRRHFDALRLVDYKLKSLRQHFVASQRLLNDLRTLRRYLLEERTSERTAPDPATSDASHPHAAA